MTLTCTQIWKGTYWVNFVVLGLNWSLLILFCWSLFVSLCRKRLVSQFFKWQKLFFKTRNRILQYLIFWKPRMYTPFSRTFITAYSSQGRIYSDLLRTWEVTTSARLEITQLCCQKEMCFKNDFKCGKSMNLKIFAKESHLKVASVQVLKLLFIQVSSSLPMTCSMSILRKV